MFTVTTENWILQDFCSAEAETEAEVEEDWKQKRKEKKVSCSKKDSSYRFTTIAEIQNDHLKKTCKNVHRFLIFLSLSKIQISVFFLKCGDIFVFTTEQRPLLWDKPPPPGTAIIMLAHFWPHFFILLTSPFFFVTDSQAIDLDCVSEPALLGSALPGNEGNSEWNTEVVSALSCCSYSDMHVNRCTSCHVKLAGPSSLCLSQSLVCCR